MAYEFKLILDEGNPSELLKPDKNLLIL